MNNVTMQISTQLTITPEMALHNLALFAIYSSRGRWMPYKHSFYLANAIQDAITTPDSRLIIEVPPRHGKTELAAIYAPAWLLKRDPYRRIIYCTYGASLAEQKSRMSRMGFKEFPLGDGLAEESQSVKEWNTAGLKGGYVAAGINGSLTGKGADLIIWDDPIKNSEDANSSVMRDKIMEYWSTTLATRQQKGTSIILIQTRWHHDDPAGRLKKKNWKTITIPALAEDNDPLGRKPGEALCPQMFDTKKLAEIKEEVGSYAWEALYQQRPAPRSGGWFNRSHFRYCYRTETGYVLLCDEGKEKSVRSTGVKIYQTIDTAGTEKNGSDYFVCLTFGVTPDNDLIVLDILREKAETTRHEAMLEQQQRKWNPLWQAVEEKSFGLNILQSARQKGRPLRSLKADKSKEVRAEPAVVHYENGKIYHLRDAHWLAQFESELVEFPRGAHDDQVDCIAYAVQSVRKDPSRRYAYLMED